METGIAIAIIAGIAAILFLSGKSARRGEDSLSNLPTTPLPGFVGIPATGVPATGVALPSPSLRERVRFWANYRSLDPALVWGVVMKESSGNPNARNPSDPSAGLMQVTPPIARAFDGVSGSDAQVLDQLLDPETNLRIGTAFLAHLRNRYAPIYPVEEWVQAYNVGETKFDKGIRVTRYGSEVVRLSLTWKG